MLPKISFVDIPKYIAIVKDTGEKYPVLEIDLENRFVVLKREEDYIKEAKEEGKRFCGCCSSGYQDFECLIDEVDLYIERIPTESVAKDIFFDSLYEVDEKIVSTCKALLAKMTRESEETDPEISEVIADKTWDIM